MKNIRFEHLDNDDLYDFFHKIEKSFCIEFGENELSHIQTLDELSDHIATKMQFEDTGGCTSQQAFYKLREAISHTAGIKHALIEPDMLLADIFPRKGRRQLVNRLEEELGMELELLKPKNWVGLLVAAIVLSSFFSLFFSWHIGVTGIIASLAAVTLMNKYKNELAMTTLRDVSDRMFMHYYLKSRRHPFSINKEEIKEVILALLADTTEMTETEMEEMAESA